MDLLIVFLTYVALAWAVLKSSAFRTDGRWHFGSAGKERVSGEWFDFC